MVKYLAPVPGLPSGSLLVATLTRKTNKAKYNNSFYQANHQPNTQNVRRLLLLRCFVLLRWLLYPPQIDWVSQSCDLNPRLRDHSFSTFLDYLARMTTKTIQKDTKYNMA